jgi:phosphatidylinositol alpha-1,6-mannosyltransferase
MIVAAFSEVLSAGGIQRMSLQSAAILTEWSAESGVPVLILSMQDPVGEHRVEVDGVPVVLRGFGNHQVRFAAAVLAAAVRADTVLLGHASFARLALPLRVVRPGLRVLTFVYGIEVWVRLRAMVRMGLRASTGVLSISEYTSRVVAELNGLDPSRIELIPCSLPPGADRAAPAAPRPTSPRCVLLSVSRLWSVETGKGIDTVIRALPRVLAEVPEAEYWIVGDGDARPGLEALAREVGVAANVRFLGRVPDEELRACYQAADVFLLPSRQEGFGIVYVEAMQQAVPVIAGNHGGAPEVVHDGVTGFLVEHGDEAAIADRVLRVLRDPALRERMGAAGRRRVEDHYTHRRFRQRLREILAPAPSATLATAK